jgi:hypothetical protein
MSQRETDLERITTLLGQCLGRIDEQAFRLQRLADEDQDTDADTLEQEAATLQELVSTLVDRQETTAHADLNRIVDRAVRDCVAEVGVPIVTRQRLAPSLPPIACTPGQLAFTVQRAVMLALGRVDSGGELVVTTRREADTTVFELECQGHGRDRHLQERCLSLCEFVAGFGGNCRVDTDERGALLLAIELPTSLPVDEY